ncbi:MAG: hypothetical protein VX730_06360 [Pseudomonadota bacterium]|nr:hypothetical protein [Pseudomonadota bacterium]
MTVEKFAYLYVHYLLPGFKIFVFLLLVLLVLAFWAKAKEGKLMDLPSQIFNGTFSFIYKTCLYIYLAIAFVFGTIMRMFRIIMATLRDFFMSRI